MFLTASCCDVGNRPSAVVITFPAGMEQPACMKAFIQHECFTSRHPYDPFIALGPCACVWLGQIPRSSPADFTLESCS